MRIRTSPSNGPASLPEYCTVITYILPRLLLPLYLLVTVSDSKVAASRLKATSPTVLPSIRDTNSSFNFQVGDRAVLRCAVQNLGSRTVIWRKTSDDHPLTVGLMTFDPEKRYEIENVSEKGEWNLFIKNVTHNDAGVYECQISTKERYIRRLLAVTVKDREYKIPAITILGTGSVVKGKSLSLYCNVTGGKQAPDDLDWLKDDQKLTSDKSGRINLTKHISGITLSTASNLTIRRMTTEDSGVYTCRTTGMAKNITVDVTNTGLDKEKRKATKDAPVKSSSGTSLTSCNLTVLLVCLQYLCDRRLCVALCLILYMYLTQCIYIHNNILITVR